MIGFLPPWERYEFEKPVCIANDKPEIEFAAAQIVKNQERAREEIQKTVAELEERHNKNAKMLFDQLVHSLKLADLYPRDFNSATDQFVLNNGVVFHVRAKT